MSYDIETKPEGAIRALYVILLCCMSPSILQTLFCALIICIRLCAWHYSEMCLNFVGFFYVIRFQSDVFSVYSKRFTEHAYFHIYVKIAIVNPNPQPTFSFPAGWQ